MQISIRAEEIFHIGSFPITNSILLAFVAFMVLVIFAVILRSKLKMIPGSIQNIAEVVIEGALSLMDSVLGRPPEIREISSPRSHCFSFCFVFELAWAPAGRGIAYGTVQRGGGATLPFSSGRSQFYTCSCAPCSYFCKRARRCRHRA